MILDYDTGCRITGTSVKLQYIYTISDKWILEKMFPMLFILHEHAVQSQLDDIRCVCFFFFLNLNHYGNHCTSPLPTPSVTVNGSKYIHLINQQCAYHHALDLSTERIAVYNDCATSARFCNNVREAIITSDHQSKLWLIIAHISLIYRKNHVRKMINNVVHSTINKNRFTLQ